MYKSLIAIIILLHLCFSADKTTSTIGWPASPSQSLNEFWYEIVQKWNRAVADLDTLFNITGGLTADSIGKNKGAIDTLSLEAISTGFVFVGAGVGLPCGSLWIHEDAVTVTIVTQNVYVKIDGMTGGNFCGVSYNADTTGFIVPAIGLYKVDWQISGDADGNNKNFEVDIFVNGVEQNDGSAKRDFGAAGSLGSMSGSSIIRITDVAHEIDFRTKNADDNTNFVIFNANFNILHVGG